MPISGKPDTRKSDVSDLRTLKCRYRVNPISVQVGCFRLAQLKLAELGNPGLRFAPSGLRSLINRCAERSEKQGGLGALKSQSGRDHVVRRSEDPDDLLGYSVFRLSRHAMVFWCAMGGERSLAQYRICRSHPTLFFSNIVLGCMRCLWAGRDSHLCSGADLDCFGIAYGHFGGARLLQIRALISARPEGVGG